MVELVLLANWMERDEYTKPVTSMHSHTVSSLYNDFYKIISKFWLFPSFKLYNTQTKFLISICPIRSLFLFKCKFVCSSETSGNWFVFILLWISLTFDTELRLKKIIIFQIDCVCAVHNKKNLFGFRGELYGVCVLVRECCRSLNFFYFFLLHSLVSFVCFFQSEENLYKHKYLLIWTEKIHCNFDCSRVDDLINIRMQISNQSVYHNISMDTFVHSFNWIQIENVNEVTIIRKTHFCSRMISQFDICAFMCVRT